jgi:hypothetical protein
LPTENAGGGDMTIVIPEEKIQGIIKVIESAWDEGLLTEEGLWLLRQLDPKHYIAVG